MFWLAQNSCVKFLQHNHRLWLDVKVQNQRAQAIYKAAGFVVEGTLRECLKSEYGYESLMIMSILQQEYKLKITDPNIEPVEATHVQP